MSVRGGTMSGIIGTTVSALRGARASIHAGRHWAPSLVEFGIPLSEVSADVSRHAVRMRPFDSVLKRGRDEWLIASYWNAVALRSNGVTFMVNANGTVVADTSAFCISASTANE